MGKSQEDLDFIENKRTLYGVCENYNLKSLDDSFRTYIKKLYAKRKKDTGFIPTKTLKVVSKHYNKFKDIFVRDAMESGKSHLVFTEDVKIPKGLNSGNSGYKDINVSNILASAPKNVIERIENDPNSFNAFFEKTCSTIAQGNSDALSSFHINPKERFSSFGSGQFFSANGVSVFCPNKVDFSGINTNLKVSKDDFKDFDINVSKYRDLNDNKPLSASEFKKLEQETIKQYNDVQEEIRKEQERMYNGGNPLRDENFTDLEKEKRDFEKKSLKYIKSVLWEQPPEIILDFLKKESEKKEIAIRQKTKIF